MKKSFYLSLAATAAVLSTISSGPVAAEGMQPIPSLVYKTGPFAPGGISIAQGFSDYFNLINERDGGVNGVKFAIEECETGYKTDRGVECYDRMKDTGGGATVINPFSTGITYALIEKATADKIPIFSMGYGRTSAADGRVFPYVFNFPATYWSQATSVISYIGSEMGGMENLKGKNFAFIYLDHPYGREPIPTLDILAEKLGFTYDKYPVPPASSTEQKSIWLQIRKTRPDYAIMWGWGVMNSTAIKEAAAIRFPMDKFIGNWWSGTEADVIPAGKGATGYKSANMHGVGDDFPVIADIKMHLYDKDKGAGDPEKIGEVLYSRALVNAAYIVEAIRIAQEKYGQRQLTGEEVRWGLENLKVTEERAAELGMAGLLPAVEVSCMNHEGSNPGIKVQQWKGDHWEIINEWVPAMTDVVRPLIEQDAKQYAEENKITPRDCSA